MKINVGFSGVLFLLFLTLKLCDVIAWSWWWVCLPLWAPITLYMIACMGIVFVAIVISAVRDRCSWH